MAPRQRHNQSPESSTPVLPVAPPSPSYGSSDNWSLQALIELQKSVGRLEATSTSILNKVDELCQRQEKVEDKLFSVEKKIYAATLLIAGFISIGAYFADKAIDFGLEMAKASAPVYQLTPAPQTHAPASEVPK